MRAHVECTYKCKSCGHLWWSVWKKRPLFFMLNGQEFYKQKCKCGEMTKPYSWQHTEEAV